MEACVYITVFSVSMRRSAKIVVFEFSPGISWLSVLALLIFVVGVNWHSPCLMFKVSNVELADTATATA